MFIHTCFAFTIDNIRLLSFVLCYFFFSCITTQFLHMVTLDACQGRSVAPTHLDPLLHRVI
jgi:hypothetical protein